MAGARRGFVSFLAAKPQIGVRAARSSVPGTVKQWNEGRSRAKARRRRASSVCRFVAASEEGGRERKEEEEEVKASREGEGTGAARVCEGLVEEDGTVITLASRLAAAVD